jgi:DNA polymerase-3 subunit gamma/tau
MAYAGMAGDVVGKRVNRMSRRALYLKWRPSTFEEVIGQEPVTRTLRHAIEQGKISHAYLFCGPRGTGKTSTARILAKAVNCIGEGPRPCNACAICQAINDGSLMDLIEIDAASHTGVDNVRELREKVSFRPNQARYKVYIIDEVHMLSNAAFNALLKTLEEPPPHVIFVLATTEPHRVPATVISRCQRFDFRYVPASTIAAHLRQIATVEGMQIDDEALELIATHAAGGVRDALSLLDQLTAYGDAEIRAEHVRALLGIGSTELVARFVDALLTRDLRAGLEIIDTLVDQGVPLRQFNAELLEYLRGMLLVKAGGESRLLHMNPEARQRLAEQAKQLELAGWARLVELFSQSAQGLKTSLQPQLPLELALVQAVSEGRAEPAPVKAAPAAAPAPPAAVPEAPAKAVETPEAQAAPAVAPAPADDALLQRLRAHWQEILRLVRPVDKDAEAFLRAAEPARVEDGQLVLAFRYEFHKKRFESQGCQAAVSQALAQVLGQAVPVKCTLLGEQGKAPTPARQQNTSARPPEPAPPAAPGRAEPSGKGAGENGAVEDPLIRAAVEKMGARVVEVRPAEAPAGEPPWPEDIPFEEDMMPEDE